jgi:hypothetical protein
MNHLAHQEGIPLTTTTTTAPVLLTGDALPRNERIYLALSDGVAQTLDGTYLLVQSGGMRHHGKPSYWYLYRYQSDRTHPREPVWRCEAFRADDAITQCNQWLAT